MSHKVIICGVNTETLPKLTAEQSHDCLVKIQQGDQECKEYFVMGNLRLVLSIVQRFNNKGNSDDLFQVGCVGLMKAINNFDLKYNVKFSTYAVPMIIGEIKRFLKEQTSIKVSRSMRDIAYKALRAKEAIENDTSSSAHIMDIANYIDLPVDLVACALDAVSEPISLYESVYKDGEDSLLLMEQLSDADCTEERLAERISLNDAFVDLPEKEKLVLDLRYYIGKTQIEISKQIGISQAQVSRLERTALERIKDSLI